MRHIIIFVTLTLTSLVYANGQPAPAGSAAQKAGGRVVVTKLPDKFEGVMLKDGQIKLKPGYKFVKRTNGTVAVARISGSVGLGNNVGGTFKCSCVSNRNGIDTAIGECGVNFGTDGINCTQGKCNRTCVLSGTVEGAKTNIIMY
jgi:hypothetical protein